MRARRPARALLLLALSTLLAIAFPAPASGGAPADRTAIRERAAAMGVVIRPMPGWLRLNGLAVGDTIYVAADREYAIEHELVHVEQQRRDGWRFFVRYALSPGWRLRYEAEAYRADVAARRWTAEECAAFLSGWAYWPATREDALRLLTAAR